MGLQPRRLKPASRPPPPPLEDDEVLPEQEPALHVPPVRVQSTQAPPPFPHALSSVPWQRPPVSQHPVLHDCAVQGTLASPPMTRLPPASTALPASAMPASRLRATPAS